MRCPQCQQELTQVGNFWICPEHGPVETPLQDSSTSKSKRKLVADSPLNIFLSYGHDQHAVERKRTATGDARHGPPDVLTCTPSRARRKNRLDGISGFD
jgi:hypothetical protein